MHKLLEIIGIMAAGGLITSLAEYKFQYNLVDSILGLFRSASADVKKVAVSVEVEAKNLEKKL